MKFSNNFKLNWTKKFFHRARCISLLICWLLPFPSPSGSEGRWKRLAREKRKEKTNSAAEKKLLRNELFFWFISFTVLFLDRASKYLVENSVNQPIDLWLFSIEKTTNTGIAWGFLQGTNSFLTLVSVVVIAGIIYYRKEFVSEMLPTIASSLILGGAVGNLGDRILQGSVLDFINFHFWPIFNIADSAISVGGILLVYWLWIKK